MQIFVVNIPNEGIISIPKPIELEDEMEEASVRKIVLGKGITLLESIPE